MHVAEPSAKSKRKAPVKYRPIKLRAPLVTLIQAWRDLTHSLDPLHNVRPASWIIDDIEIIKLARCHPVHLRNASDLAYFLEDTPDTWKEQYGTPLIDVILKYDASNKAIQKKMKKMREKEKATVDSDTEEKEVETNETAPQVDIVTEQPNEDVAMKEVVDENTVLEADLESDASLDERLVVAVKKMKIGDSRPALADKKNTLLRRSKRIRK